MRSNLIEKIGKSVIEIVINLLIRYLINCSNFIVAQYIVTENITKK